MTMTALPHAVIGSNDLYLDECVCVCVCRVQFMATSRPGCAITVLAVLRSFAATALRVFGGFVVIVGEFIVLWVCSVDVMSFRKMWVMLNSLMK